MSSSTVEIETALATHVSVTKDALSVDLSDGRTVTVNVQPNWARAFPQSAHLLREEAVAWARTPWQVVLR